MGQDYLEGWQRHRTMDEQLKGLMGAKITIVADPTPDQTINVVGMEKVHTTTPTKFSGCIPDELIEAAAVINKG